jgi:hypothetical protein
MKPQHLPLGEELRRAIGTWVWDGQIPPADISH